MENYNAIWITIVAVLLTWFFTSCVTNDRRADDDLGRRDMALIGQLEAQFDEFDRRISRIEETAGDITTDIDRVRDLFIEYTRLVQQLRSTVAIHKIRLTEETETSEKAELDSGDTSDLFRKY